MPDSEPFRPIGELADVRQAMHVVIRTPDGCTNSWRYLPYKPDARRQGYPHGRWQIATDYSFRNATLPTKGDWRPARKATPC